MLGTSSRITLSPGGTLQTDSTRHVVSSSASGIAITPTPLSGPENLPTTISVPEACAIITNPMQKQGTEMTQRKREW